eukprot:CAMPEP_0184324766 /NCGR_PEP_ID=MMETSP1049-20130417/136801_1 /TAXON_ID=77928 /ORGANISM="Proteomonas sulcata, Strain CCMP704" /LENGTH=152 /DNA_ID=CAMNT_0026646621 /DNA_START=17 /DNA_END=475 /DNA_ORIENTATION=-
MGRGGMASKIDAAQVAANGGVTCVIANGFDISNVHKVFDGQDIGTVFPALERPTKLQHWLAHAANPSGAVVVTKTALQKLMDDNAAGQALNAMDIAEIKGDFGSNSAVALETEEGRMLGMCLVEHGNSELEQLITGNLNSSVINPKNMFVHQ